MRSAGDIAASLVGPVLAAPRQGRRKLVAVAGPPASGKSTITELLAKGLTDAGTPAQVVPMDGFHLDNRLLVEKGLLPRKGAPETFDLGGFARLVQALGVEEHVYYPTFDRSRDLSVGSSGEVGPDCDTLVIEGNYLMFDAPGWRDLAGYWDFSIWLDVPLDILEQRLIARWLHYGMAQADAEARARGNDLRNARRLAAALLPTDMSVGL